MPFGSSSIYSQWEVMKLVSSQNIKVLLDGQGADEILGGYYSYAGLFLIENSNLIINLIKLIIRLNFAKSGRLNLQNIFKFCN